MATTQIITEPAVPQVVVTRGRDTALLSEIAEGINESLERLDQLLARLAPVS